MRFAPLLLFAAALAVPVPAALADANVDAPPIQNVDYEVGAAAVKMQDWPRAISHLTAALKADGTNADIHNLLGYAYRKDGNLDAAFRQYDEALKLDPKHRGAHEYIGEAYLIAGNRAKAQEHLAALGRICGKGCEEYLDLAKAIATAR
ncbi:MAG: tetratricopeptide repeat protein [Betaproteobacteria bacterium]